MLFSLIFIIHTHLFSQTPPASIVAPHKRAREPATPTKSKRMRGAPGAVALHSKAMTAVLAPTPSTAPSLNPSPICMANVIEASLHLETEWLTVEQKVALVNLLCRDRSAHDTYNALIKDVDTRKAWVRSQLEAEGIIF